MEPYDRKNLKFARHNRKVRNATPQEGILWHLFLKKCEVNFTRQFRVDTYILDFFAPSIKLAVEVDGGQHYEDSAIVYDQERSDLLSVKGITVLRFTNTDVDKNLNGVIIAIKQEIRKLKKENERI